MIFTENHDQVANSGEGSRLHARTSPGRYRAITALMLLSPGTPMLFQGQEFGASSPFLFFADHDGELADAVQRGRAEFVSHFFAEKDGRHRSAAPWSFYPTTTRPSRAGFTATPASFPCSFRGPSAATGKTETRPRKSSSCLATRLRPSFA